MKICNATLIAFTRCSQLKISFTKKMFLIKLNSDFAFLNGFLCSIIGCDYDYYYGFETYTLRNCFNDEFTVGVY